MWSTLKRCFDVLVFGNFVIAFGSFFELFVTQQQFDLNIKVHPYHLLVCGGTLFVYSLHRLSGIRNRSPLADDPLRLSWAHKNAKIVLATVVLGAVAVLSSLLWAKPQVLLCLGALAVFALGYTFPIIGGRDGEVISLRQLPYAKTIFVASIWAAVVVGIPLLYEERSLLDWRFTLSLIARAFWVFSITILFDLRDARIDAVDHVRSLALLGYSRTKLLAAFCCTIFIGISVLLFAEKSWPDSVVGACTFLLIYNTRPDRNDYYYLFLIDGLMALHGLLWLGF